MTLCLVLYISFVYIESVGGKEVLFWEKLVILQGGRAAEEFANEDLVL